MSIDTDTPSFERPEGSGYRGNGEEIIRLEGLSKTFVTPEHTIEAVKPTDLVVRSGEIFGLVGFSGAGKSTLLRLINRLEEPTTGKVWVDGQEVTALRRGDLHEARRRIGMVFQTFNLQSNKTVLQNVLFALNVAGKRGDKARERAMEALDVVGLKNRAQNYPAQLSGGQKQRVGIARALANEPAVLLSDEATSALDPHTTLTILEFLARVNREFGLTVVVVTHEINVITYLCHRVGVMQSGEIIEMLDLVDGKGEAATPLGAFLFDTAHGWTPHTKAPEGLNP